MVQVEYNSSPHWWSLNHVVALSTGAAAAQWWEVKQAKLISSCRTSLLSTFLLLDSTSTELHNCAVANQRLQNFYRRPNFKRLRRSPQPVDRLLRGRANLRLFWPFFASTDEMRDAMVMKLIATTVLEFWRVFRVLLRFQSQALPSNQFLWLSLLLSFWLLPLLLSLLSFLSLL